MIQSILGLLNSMKIVLASSSPRRQQIVKNIGLNVILCPSLFEENLNPDDFNKFEDFVIETALQKVLEVENRLNVENNIVDVIIGGDTMMIFEGKLIGKPKDAEDAFDMLTKMSGKWHTIITGVAIKNKKETKTFFEKTDVLVADLTPEQIQGYIDSGEPLDKAGSYGIQGIGGTMVKRIEGDYYNVIGLPLYKVSEALYEMYKK